MLDNFINDLGGPRQMSQVEENWHQEQKRKQYDVIRVINPDSVTVQGKVYSFPPEDFFVEYDTNQWQRIPKGTTTDVPHYIALRYVEHKKNDIINKVAQKMHDELLADREKKGLQRYTDKYAENKETYETNPFPKTNDAELTYELYSQLWLGLVYEFGKDKPPMNANPRSGEVNLASAAQQAIDRLNSRRVDPTSNQSVVSQNLPRTQPVIPTQPSGYTDLNRKLTPEEISQ